MIFNRGVLMDRIFPYFLSFTGLLLIACGLSSCTTTAESQLKESPCLECAKKTPLYRNGEWLHG